jgi:hypothetical protein
MLEESSPLGVTRYVPDPQRKRVFVTRPDERGRLGRHGAIEGFFRNAGLTLQVAVVLEEGGRILVPPCQLREPLEGLAIPGVPC